MNKKKSLPLKVTNDKLEWWQYKSAHSPPPRRFLFVAFFYMYDGMVNKFISMHVLNIKTNRTEWIWKCMSFVFRDKWRQRMISEEVQTEKERALNFLSHFTFFIAHACFFVSFSLIQIALHSFAILFYDPTNTPLAWMKNVFIYWKEVGTKIYYVAYFNILWRNIL